MSFFWIYDLPNWLLGLLTVLLFAGLAAAGLVATRPLVRRAFGPPPGHNDVVSYYLGAFGVFYGLTMGLIAVATWQNFTDLDGLVAEEAAALRVLDRARAVPPARAGRAARAAAGVRQFVIERGVAGPVAGRGPEAGPGAAHGSGAPDGVRAGDGGAAGPARRGPAGLRPLPGAAPGAGVRRDATGLPAVVWWVLLAGAAAEHRADLPVRPVDAAGRTCC